MDPMSAAAALEPLELSERILVVVNPQIQRRPFLAFMDQNGSRLLAALVAAGAFARAHCSDQPLREGEGFVADIDPCGLLQDLRACEHVAGNRKTVAGKMPAPFDAILAGKRGD